MATLKIKDENGNWQIVRDPASGGVGNGGDENGADGITPKLRINAETNEWEVSYDNGVSWDSLGVKATGADGENGEDGYTPVRGTDYWTEADKAEIKSYVDEAILGGEW